MKAEEILEKARELVGEGNIDKAQQFIEDHKEDLGSYTEKAKNLISENSQLGEDLLDKIKGFFK